MMGETAFGIPAFPVATTAANIAAGTDCFAYDCVYDVTYTFPNGNVMTLALTREPGRAIWITRRDYEFNADSLQAAAGGENVLVMNFANAHVVGGGFWLGATAQEEALCRNSTLYASISSPAARALYRANNWPLHAMETDAMIYSPSVAVFRAPSGELLRQPYVVSVVSVPAPNRRGLACLTSQACLSETMRRRLVNVLCLARQKGHRRLVLGAWGCGAFGHRAENVAGYFRQILVEEGRQTWFDDVCFAIYGSVNGRNFRAFQAAFQCK